MDDFDISDTAKLKEKIAAQADEQGGWIALTLLTEDGSLPKSGRSFLRVPRNPFILWCLTGYDFNLFEKEKPVWTPVSPIGLKMSHDNQYHSDWVIGAGLRIDEAYGDNYNKNSIGSLAFKAAWEMRVDLVDEYTDHKFVILAKDKQKLFSGKAVFAEPNKPVEAGSIAIAPNAGEEYQAALISASKPNAYGQKGLLICETGGKLAHLSIVAREVGATLVVLDKALSKIKEGSYLSLNIEKGTINIPLN